MTCSPARLAANRANALKSTGPRTAAGKERSRANAVKHGLTGEGVAIPTEDVAVVAGRFEALREELAPRTVLGGILVKRAAMLSVRLDRSERREAAALASRVEHAGEAFDEARMGEVQRLVGLLDDDPAGAVRNLRRMPEGVDRLIAGWSSIRQDIEIDGMLGWFSSQRQLAVMLDGRPAEGVGFTRIEALFRATSGEFQYLGPGDGAGLDDLDRREWALARLKEAVDARLADLRAHRATLDAAAIARDRARAADVALFDTSKEAVLARKYEAAAERALFRALRELRQVEAEARDEGLGSFSPADDEAESEAGQPAPRPLGPTPGAPETPNRPLPSRPNAPSTASESPPRRPS